MKRFKIYLSTIILVASSISWSQDFHLSQYDAAPMYLNPALTGLSQDIMGDYRASINSRRQWRALGKPFSTDYVSFDKTVKNTEERYGIGGYMINNRSGIGNFSTFNFMASGAYNIMKTGSPHILRIGLNMGLLNKSFAFERYTFDNQYSSSTGTFDQNIAHNENLMSSSVFRFDAAFGIFYRFVDETKKYTPSIGLALHHITMPKENFGALAARVPIRWTAHTECRIKVNEELFVTPKILFMQQAKATELNIGMSLGYKINDDYTILPGLYYRNRDAFIFDFGLQFARNILRFGYDVNNSYLRQFTSGRGAFEISLIMIFEKGRPILPKKRQNKENEDNPSSI